jgi:hypothetical protein
MQLRDLVHLQITHSGRSISLSLDPESSLSSLLATLEQEFSVSSTTAKLLSKGKKLNLLSDDQPAATTLEKFLSFNSLLRAPPPASNSSSSPLKLLLIGPRSDALLSLKATEELREKKRLAFSHHQSIAHLSKPTPASRIRSLGDAQDEQDKYKFWELEPFPKETVPCYEKRLAMLKRLSEDDGVRDIMKRHKFAVGVL